MTTCKEFELSDAILEVGFWRELASDFSIDRKRSKAPFALTDAEKKMQSDKILREGYIHLANPGLVSPFGKIAQTIAQIVTRGLPPVFIFVYDELWLLNRQLRHLLSHLLHEEYAMLPDFWAWCVMPGQAGWKPHRDKNADSLFPDKRPKSLTVWIPITKAHPLNSCMYVLPADRDGGYGLSEPQGGLVLPDIRALPAEPGDVLAWTQHLLHWGCRSADAHDLPPRMSVAFEFQRRDVPPFNQPLLDPTVLPSFSQRLALIGKQVMQYRHMYGFHDDLVNLAWKIATSYELPKSL